jgi:hypothetical protein
VSNILELKARYSAKDTAKDTVGTEQAAARADLRALQDLQLLCEKAHAAGGLDAGGPTVLDLTVAVHRAVKGSEWNVRFYRGQATGL